MTEEQKEALAGPYRLAVLLGHLTAKQALAAERKVRRFKREQGRA